VSFVFSLWLSIYFVGGDIQMNIGYRIRSHIIYFLPLLSTGFWSTPTPAAPPQRKNKSAEDDHYDAANRHDERTSTGRR